MILAYAASEVLPKLILVFFIVLLAGCAAGGWYYLQKQKKIKNKKEENVRTAPIAPFPNNAPMVQAPRRGGILIGNAQDIGSREEQQDAFGLSNLDAIASTGLLAILADGMGGMKNGAAYSRVAVQAALQSFQLEAPEKNDEATVLRILKRAREAVAAANLTDGGSTFIAALIHNQQLHFVSVGDSRIYLMRNGGLIQLNREHVYGRELDDLALNGMLSREEAEQDRQRAAITSYLGKQDELNVDRNINPIPLYSGDKVVLMSDGIFNFLPEPELAELLYQKPMKAAEAVKNAVLSKKHPHQDNMTIVIVEIE